MQNGELRKITEAACSSALASLGPDDLSPLISIEEAIALVDKGMRLLSAGDVASPQRWSMPVGEHGLMAIMPGAAPGLGRFGIKVLGLFPPGMRIDLPSHQGVMLLFDLADGRPLCAIDAHALTVLRTAAASAVATRTLSRPDASILAILGCGEQARLHIEAICRVRHIEHIRLWNRTPARAKCLARHCGAISSAKTLVTDDPVDAVRGAHIVCTLTAASDPLLFGANLEPGQHLNLVGSSRDGPREVDDEVVAKARYFADSREHALREGSELVHAIRSGIVNADHLVAEIGEVLNGSAKGRISASDITLYKSLGHIVQDLVVADTAYRRWEAGSTR
ncbi:ornithine cyclodeaminase family protein [Sphingomonas koreensis]|nr:ornithine cyclodeaminase family protein [Sphingomonas koreensis]